MRRHRVAAGLSQEALASAARVHPTYVCLFERGLRDPKLTWIQKLARALDLSIPALVAEADARS